MIPYLRGTLRALRETGRNMFRPKITQGMRGPELHEPRYRASFALVDDEHGEDACIACMACVHVCPSGVIDVVADERKPSPATGKKRGWARDWTLNLQACVLCELCVQVCPTDAIVMVRQQEKPGFSREDLVLTRERLRANAADKPRAWVTGSALKDMQDPQKGCAS